MVHHSNVLSRLGWTQFLHDVEANLYRPTYSAFGVMCSKMMAKFIEGAGLEVVALDCKLISRDCVAVWEFTRSGLYEQRRITEGT